MARLLMSYLFAIFSLRKRELDALLKLNFWRHVSVFRVFLDRYCILSEAFSCHTYLFSSNTPNIICGQV